MQPIILDATTKTIKVIMSGAAATTNPDYTAGWADDTASGFTEGASDGALNGAADVTVVAAPAASTRRVIKYISIANRDSAAVTVTIKYDNNGTQRTIAIVTLAVGDTWTSNGTYDTNGNLKVTTAGGGANTALSNLAAVAINTSLLPGSDDGAALGSTSKNFSDLFLASGAVINYANSNVVITHTSGILTMGTGDFRVTNAGTNSASVVTVGGTQTLTSKTLTSPTLTTPSAFTTGGTITLAENTSIALDPAGSADGKYTGITIAATAGYTQAFGDLVYLDPTDSRWEACDANSAAGADGDSRGIIGMVVSAGTDGTACTILLSGVIRADAKFPSFTINNPIYVSETAGSVTQTQPTTTDVVIRVVGFALTADEMYFNPSADYITHV